MKNIISILSFLFVSMTALAQISTHSVGNENNTPIDLSKPFDLIVFVILPIAILILFLIWRNTLKKDKEALERENKNNPS